LQVRQNGSGTQDSKTSNEKKIAEILGIFTETQRGKDWLLKEIAKHRLKIPTKTSLNSFEILNQCPQSFITNLHRALKGESVEGYEEVQSLAKTYHWLFTDIVGGANPTTPTKEQVRKIVVLNELMKRTETFRNRDVSSTVILPVGDGVAVGFSDSAEKPLHLAMELHKALYRYNESTMLDKIVIRIGIDMGPVYFVKDLNGKDNVWGPGIILTRRVMDLCGPMNIFVSERMAKELLPLSPEYGHLLHPIGKFEIKHGEELSIYNIYGRGFGNIIFPKKKKVFTISDAQQIVAKNNYTFNEYILKLEVTNPKTLSTHHTLVWDIVNVSKKEMTEIFYFIDGDTPKEFGDMNVIVKDKDSQLVITAVNENKPYHKAFNVQLTSPIPPKKGRMIVMEYDWEEPLRMYFFRAPAKCAKFSYSLVAPKEFELKTGIQEVDAVSGSKVPVLQPPVVGSDGAKNLVTWSKNDLVESEQYEFTW
jgi:hypothetical protein